MRFKIGDNVKVIKFDKDVSGYNPNDILNNIGEIINIVDEVYPYAVKFTENEEELSFAEDELDFVEPCEYCKEGLTEPSLCGDDGVIHDKRNDSYYIFAEHYKDECIRIKVNYCPRCGRKLA